MGFTGPRGKRVNSMGQRDQEAEDVKIPAILSEQLTATECKALNSLLHTQ